MTSPPVWAIIVAHTCNNWGSYTVLTCVPLYMKEVLNFDIKAVSLIVCQCHLKMCLTETTGNQFSTQKLLIDCLFQNGVLVSLPYVFMYFLTIFASQLGDFLLHTKIFTTTTVRKIFQTIGRPIRLSVAVAHCFATRCTEHITQYKVNSPKICFNVSSICLQRSASQLFLSLLLASSTVRTDTGRSSS